MKKVIKSLIVLMMLFLFTAGSFASDSVVYQTGSMVLMNGELVEFEKTSVVDEIYYRVEAENNIIVGFARKDIITDDGGGEAIGYFQSAGDSITFNDCPSATSLTFRYANIMDITGVMLYVDGKKIDTLNFPNTKGYNVYKKITVYALIPEDSNIKIKLGTNGALNIDYIDFSGVCTLARDIVSEEVEEVEEGKIIDLNEALSNISKITRREAENPKNVVLSGDMRIEWGAITNFDSRGETVTFKDCPAATSLIIRYATHKNIDIPLYVNGKVTRVLKFQGTYGYDYFADYKVSVNIPEGANVKLEIRCFNGINLDYIDFIDEEK